MKFWTSKRIFLPHPSAWSAKHDADNYKNDRDGSDNDNDNNSNSKSRTGATKQAKPPKRVRIAKTPRNNQNNKNSENNNNSSINNNTIHPAPTITHEVVWCLETSANACGCGLVWLRVFHWLQHQQPLIPDKTHNKTDSDLCYIIRSTCNFQLGITDEICRGRQTRRSCTNNVHMELPQTHVFDVFEGTHCSPSKLGWRWWCPTSWTKEYLRDNRDSLPAILAGGPNPDSPNQTSRGRVLFKF